MLYPYIREEIKQGDHALFAWQVDAFEEMRLGKGVAQFLFRPRKEGKWIHAKGPSTNAMIPVVVQEVTDEYVRVDFYHEAEPGKFDLIVIPENKSYMRLDFQQTEEVFPRLFKYDWKNVTEE